MDVLTDAQRATIRAHRAELIAYLTAASQTTRDLIEASIAACDAHGDGPAGRAQMVEEVMEVPEGQREHLLAYFREVYGKRRLSGQ